MKILQDMKSVNKKPHRHPDLEVVGQFFSFQDKEFFSTVWLISGKTGRIFTKILSYMYLWQFGRFGSYQGLES